MIKTFLDSGVLLTAWRGKECAEEALAVMDDDNRTFVSCQFVRLELLPKPAFFKEALETEFYNTHFAGLRSSEPLSQRLGDEAMNLASKYGLAAADAINLCAAIRLGAEEFVTSEKPGKPMFRVPGIKVTSLHEIKHPPAQPAA